MQLINATVNTIVREIHSDYLIVENLETKERFEFAPQDNKIYVPGEELEIRVDSIQRNLLIGRIDGIDGEIVNSFPMMREYAEQPVFLEELGEWDPDYLFGEKASKVFFPQCSGKKYRMLEIKTDLKSNDKIKKLRRKVDEKMEQEDYRSAFEIEQSILADQPYHIPTILRMYFHIEQLGDIQMMEAYVRHFVHIVERAFPDLGDRILLDSRIFLNMKYMQSLATLAELAAHKGNQDESLALFRKVYRLDPYDTLMVRFRLHEDTGEPFPLLDSRSPIEPYLFIREYNIPVRDKYDPNLRPAPKKWLSWSSMYKHILIIAAHENDRIWARMSREEKIGHIRLHEYCEDVLAANAIPGIRLQFMKILAEGVPRHEALHVVGEAILSAAASEDDSA